MTPVTTPLALFRERFSMMPHATAPMAMVSQTAGRNDLAVLFRDLGYRTGAEIGVWQGRFSEQLCLANPGVQLLCVDPWKAYDDYGDPKNEQSRLEEAWRQTVKRLSRYRCEIRRQTSIEAAKTVPDGSLDFIFLDANHGKAFVLADLEAWVPKVRSGGVISGHDYELVPRRAHLQVKAAVEEWRQAHDTGPLYVLALDKTPSFFWLVL